VELRHPFEGIPALGARELDDAIRRFNRGELTPGADADIDPVHGVAFPKLAPLFERSPYFERRYGLDFDRHVFPAAAADERPFFLFLNLHMCLIAEPDPGLVQRYFLETLMVNARRLRARLEPAAEARGVSECLARNYEQLGLSNGGFESGSQLVRQALDNRFYDASFEAVWRYLERRGLARDTAVVATSDHGMSFGEHGEPVFTHDGALPYEYVTRVPVVIRLPEGSRTATEPASRSERVSLVDLFPTLLELALGRGVFERDLPIMGRSLLERVESRAFEPVLIAESSLLPAPGLRGWPDVTGYAKAVYAGKYKLIAAPVSYRGPRGAFWPTAVRLGEDWPFAQPRPAFAKLEPPLTQLYDLERDPHERRDIAGAHPELVEQLRGLVAPEAWACQPLQAGGQAPRFSEEARDTLRALGYVE
jgi:hypothetical protein